MEQGRPLHWVMVERALVERPAITTKATRAPHGSHAREETGPSAESWSDARRKARTPSANWSLCAPRGAPSVGAGRDWGSVNPIAQKQIVPLAVTVRSPPSNAVHVALDSSPGSRRSTAARSICPRASPVSVLTRTSPSQSSLHSCTRDVGLRQTLATLASPRSTMPCAAPLVEPQPSMGNSSSHIQKPAWPARS
eukprot:scaffold132316_cov27-Tisochrysis_lutea.AAC.3